MQKEQVDAIPLSVLPRVWQSLRWSRGTALHTIGVSKGGIVQAIELVTYLRGRESVPADELKAAFDVSSRTVRLYVQRTNEALAGIAHISYARKLAGYTLVVTDEAALDAWAERMGAFADSDTTAAGKRVSYLINDLVLRNDWVTIADMAQVLFVSPQSVSKDLKAVAGKLAEFGLTLERKPRYGVRVVGPEMARRLCLASIASEGLIGSRAFGDEALPQVVKDVAACIEEALAETSFYISMLAFQNLVVHIVVAFRRIQDRCLILLDDEMLERIARTSEFAAARRVADRLIEKFGIELPDTEVAYIAIHLAGKKSIVPADDAAPSEMPAPGAPKGPAADGADASHNLVIPEEVWGVVTEMLGRVWELFHFDFRDNLELRMNLARHIVPLATRLRFNLSVDNPLLSDIRMRFPLAFAMAGEASGVLAAHYGASLSEEETGYIALAFALALDRLREEGPKRNVLVVCASGLGTSRLLESAIRRRFGGRIDRIVPCDALHVSTADLTGIDYIFTTVPLEGEFPVPIQEIHSFLDDIDIRQIDELLSDAPPATAGTGLFDPAWFEPHLKARTPTEAIRALAGRMVELGAAAAELVELAVAREEVSSTAFGSGLALPHPIRSLPGPTRVCAGIPERPIRWGDKDVELVLLVVIGDDGRNALDWLFSRIAELLSHEERVRCIADDRGYATLVREIAHGEERN